MVDKDRIQARRAGKGKVRQLWKGFLDRGSASSRRRQSRSARGKVRNAIGGLKDTLRGK